MTLIGQLKKGKEKKVLNGYPWVFRDELKSLEGETSTVSELNLFSYNFDFLGRGYYNPHSNRAVMVLTNRDTELDESFFQERLKRALAKRQNLYDGTFYRLVHGEGDRLPGLVVDRYDKTLVVQFRNRIMQELKPTIIQSLVKTLAPVSIYERSDFEAGVEDRIERNTGPLYGEVPEKLEIVENGLRFGVDIKKSQKTGFFFDQRDSRAFCRKITANLSLERGLDLFSFTGGFGLNMASAGAKVVCVDKSIEDLELARINFKLNGLDKSAQLVQNDVFDYLGGFEIKDLFDIVVLDPPSFVKHKRELSHGIGLFKKLVEGSFPLIRDGGVLGICTCAYNIGLEHLVEAVRRASENTGITFSHLAITLQSPDHPWLVQVPESLYLKCLWGIVEKE